MISKVCRHPPEKTVPGPKVGVTQCPTVKCLRCGKVRVFVNGQARSPWKRDPTRGRTIQ